MSGKYRGFEDAFDLFINDNPKRFTVYTSARKLSQESRIAWYVIKHPKRPDLTCTKNDLDRFIRMGYEVVCIYKRGKRYQNEWSLPTSDWTLADLLRVAKQDSYN